VIDAIVAATLLLEAPGIGCRGLRALVDRFGDVVGALDHAEVEPVRRARADRAARQRAWRRAERYARSGGRLVTAAAAEFPGRLRQVPWGPPCLFVHGSRLPSSPVATIVGTRRAGPGAVAFAEQVARQTAAEGIVVASGLALGIDAAAHQGALSATAPTLAVVGTGTDVCYPRAHADLRRAILDGGWLVSELPPGAPPLAHHFPLRNRILAGFAEAVAVIQAPERSGALITAHFALEADVELLAAPGDPWMPENAGSNALLAEGARPLLAAVDLVRAVAGEERCLTAPDRGAGLLPLPRLEDATDRRLVAAVDTTPRTVDRLGEELALAAAPLQARLVRLELDGWLERVGTGHVRLTPAGAAARGRQGSGAPTASEPATRVR